MSEQNSIFEYFRDHCIVKASNGEFSSEMYLGGMMALSDLRTRLRNEGIETPQAVLDTLHQLHGELFLARDSDANTN